MGRVFPKMKKRLGRRSESALVALAALVAYVPIVFSSPGLVGADTKTYLYLDPGRLMQRATSLWDSDAALGTVTHQTIGFLWPMGPFYWTLEKLGSPDWFAQRLWLASLLLVGALGVRYLLRTLGWEGSGLLVAMLAYELSPYLLDYSARISVILLPWAGLPWLLGLTIRSVRSGGWRHPAMFALVAVTVGSVNATSLLLIGLAPVLWIVHASMVERSVSIADAARAALRIGVTSLGVSLWWIAGLFLQGGYSLPVPRYTETYQVVAEASTAPEILRGLGYWFFYGNDKFGPWIEPSVDYTQGVWLIFVSFGLVVLALLGAAMVRWRHRSYFLLLLVVGALIGIGSHPFDSPSLLGRFFSDFTRTDAGLALRSTPRAVPMVVLATSVLLGSLVNAMSRRWPAWGRGFGLLVLLAVVLNNPAMWKIRMIEPHLNRPENIPEYWLDATDQLDSLDDGSRVMELPGSDFASYRWGNTVDPITPGLMDRGYVSRELVPFGSAQSAALLGAFDRRFQEDAVDLDAVIPISRLMSIGDLVHRADLTYERFRTPRPVPTAALLDSVDGLGTPEGFGEPVPNVAGPEALVFDEVFLGTPADLPDPAPVTRYSVPDPLAVIRAEPMGASTVLVGGASGLVDAAGAGLVDPQRSIFFAADLLSDPDAEQMVLAGPSQIIITDSNRKRAKRWGTLRENVGYTERAGEVPLVYDPTDNRLDVFPDLDTVEGLDVDDTRTVAVDIGPVDVSATAYGNPVTYTNDDRAVFAVDGDPDTAWVVAAFAEPRGEFLRLDHHEPIEIAEITLKQPSVESNRHITEVKISADGREIGRFRLDESSLGPDGQAIGFGSSVTGTTWDIEIADVDFPRQATYPGVSPVGFAEVRLGDDATPVVELIRTPRAFVDRLGVEIVEHDLSVVLNRERSNPSEPVRDDPEAAIVRRVPLPVGRSFEVAGSVRLSAYADEVIIDGLLGRSAGLDGIGLSAWSSGRLPGDLRSAASSALDGDRSTAWTGVFGPQAGQSITIERAEPLAVESITVDVVTDLHHSVPTVLRLFADGIEIGDFPTGLTTVDSPRGTTSAVVLPVSTAGSRLTLQAVEVIERRTLDWYSHTEHAMPISIAEVDFGAGIRFGAAVDLATVCRSDLLSIDGRFVAVEVVGSAVDGAARDELQLVGCDPVDTIGDIEVAAVSGTSTGFDLDQIVLTSSRPVLSPVSSPDLVVDRRSDTEFKVQVPGSASDRWLILGQSHNRGWRATADGVDLGAPIVIDGFANGWVLPAGSDSVVRLTWTPQRYVSWMLLLSLFSVAVCLAMIWFSRQNDPAPNRPGRFDGPASPEIGPVPLLERSDPVGVGRVPMLAGAATAVVFAAINLPQWLPVALVMGPILVLGVRWRRFGSTAPLLATASLGLASIYIMIQQRRFRYPPDFVWPQQFERVHVLGVLAVLLIFVEYVRSAVSPTDAGEDSSVE